MNNVTNKLRVVHFPQVGINKSFKVEVKDEEYGWVDYFNEVEDMEWDDIEKILTAYLTD